MQMVLLLMARSIQSTNMGMMSFYANYASISSHLQKTWGSPASPQPRQVSRQLSDQWR